jgi:uncharacterized membrane-anchored protein
MRRTLVILAGVLALAVVNWTIAAREQLLADGRVVLLALAPVDPRSLMQGDYMALRFEVANAAFARNMTAASSDGHIVVKVSDDGVAAFRRFDDGTPLAPDEARLRYRIRGGAPRFATNAYFFEEGRAQEYANARFGELRVAADGEAILTGLRDAQRQPLGTSATR